MTKAAEEGLKTAVNTFVSERIQQIARKVIYRLQRMPDPGSHPYGWHMETLWNLYSWDVQNGPIEDAELLADLVDEVVSAAVAALPEAEAVLLSLGVAQETLPPPTRADHEIATAVTEKVSRTAARRNLDRYDPDFRWYDNL
jgi:hypothetical protein